MLKLWLAARDRERRAAVRTATQAETLIIIDGTPEPFLTLTPPAVVGSPSATRWVTSSRALLDGAPVGFAKVPHPLPICARQFSAA